MSDSTEMKTAIADILSKSRTAFKLGTTRDISWRRNQLKQLLLMLEEHEEDFIQALAVDLDKPRQEAITLEIEYNRNVIRNMLDNLGKWMKDEHVPKSLTTLLDRAYIRREPLGVVLVVAPWNYPLMLTVAPLAGAVAAGNAVVVKPSERAPATADLVKNLCAEYMDKDLVHVVTGEVEVSKALLEFKYDHIFFTGSLEVGKMVAAEAAKTLTPCTLELGGKCPVYLDDTADMDVSARRIVWAKMVNMGQTCVAPDYLLCSSKAVRDKFVDKATEVYKEFFASGKNEDFCRLINAAASERIGNLLEDATEKKLTVTHLGDVKGKDLSLITGEDFKDALVMKSEVFGPILSILTVGDGGLEAASEFIREYPKPLALYIFSTDKKTQKHLMDNTSSGTVCVNDLIVQLSVDSLPFGGVGESGYGKYHGFYSFKTFSHEKSVLERNFNWFGEWMGKARYPPYSEEKVEWLSGLVRHRRWLASGCGFILGKVVCKAIAGLCCGCCKRNNSNEQVVVEEEYKPSEVVELPVAATEE